MPDWGCSNQIVIPAQSESILNLPGGKFRFKDIADQPISIVGNNNAFVEQGLFAADQIGVF